MSGQIEEPAIDFKSEHGRILQTDAFDLLDTIAAAIGTDGIKFPVHEAVIRKSSKFFDNAMKPEWTASRLDARTICLVNEDPAIFKIYLHWLYFKTFPTVLTKNINMLNQETVVLSKCYVMGEMLMDIGFKNSVLIAFRDAMLNQPFGMSRSPASHIIEIIYDGTPEGSSARRLMVDIWLRDANESWVSFMDELPPAFLLDLSKALILCKRTSPAQPKSWKLSMEDFQEA